MPSVTPKEPPSPRATGPTHEPRAWTTISDLLTTGAFHPGCSCGWSTREDFDSEEEAEAWTKEVHNP